jgi:hypothetical protein
MVQRRLHPERLPELLPERLPDLPPAIAASPLLAQGGIGVYEGLVAGTVLQQLIDEAMRSYATAADQGSTAPNPEENRGGTPLRRFLTGAGGPVQEAFYQSDWVRAFLEHSTGLKLKPTGSTGTFSYYVRPGDFLDLHRDIVTCDLAVITLLHQDGPASNGSGALCVYPARHRETLSAIRKTPNQGAFAVEPQVGHTMVLLGGVIPHCVLPIQPDQRRITSVLCYRAQLDDATEANGSGGCGC